MWMQKIERKTGGVTPTTPTPSHLKYVVRRDGSLKFPKATSASASPLNRMELIGGANVVEGGSPSKHKGHHHQFLDEDPTDVEAFVLHHNHHHGNNQSASFGVASLSSSPSVAAAGGTMKSGASSTVMVTAPPPPALLDVDHDISEFATGRSQHGPSSSPAAAATGQQLQARLKLPPEVLGSRKSASVLEASMLERMSALREEKDISRVDFVRRAHGIFNDVMHELVRQVSVACQDRGRLLAKVWVRSTELVNTFSEMFVEEKDRHLQEEARIQATLRATRLDYLSVVSKFEEMVKQQHEVHAQLIEESVRKEEEHRERVEQLKEELYRLQAAMRHTQSVMSMGTRKKSSVTFARSSGAGVGVAAPFSASSDAFGAEMLASSQSHDGSGSGRSGMGGSPLVTFSASFVASQPLAATMHPTQSSGSTPLESGTVVVPAISIGAVGDDSDLVHQLRNELQQQKLALLDATNELTRLADKSFLVTTGMNTDALPVTERGVSPVAELLRYLRDSDSDEEDFAASPRSRQSASASGNSRLSPLQQPTRFQQLPSAGSPTAPMNRVSPELKADATASNATGSRRSSRRPSAVTVVAPAMASAPGDGRASPSNV